MPRILVVDDEAEIRDLIWRVLAREGYQVDTAVHGAAALGILGARAYDLVICNVRMPVMDGPTLYGQVLGTDGAQASRFLFCTGDIVSSDVRSFLLGINQPVLTKPFSISSLRETVRRFLAEPAGGRWPLAHFPEERLVTPPCPA
jgi:CheY-like chemotaxis protein